MKVDDLLNNKKITPMKAIRKRCLDCCCYQANEVKLCTCVNCPLYPYRMGKKPKVGTVEYSLLFKES